MTTLDSRHHDETHLIPYADTLCTHIVWLERLKQQCDTVPETQKIARLSAEHKRLADKLYAHVQTRFIHPKCKQLAPTDAFFTREHTAYHSLEERLSEVVLRQQDLIALGKATLKALTTSELRTALADVVAGLMLCLDAIKRFKGTQAHRAKITSE